MVKVIHVGDDGSETAVIELDDFTIETVYAGISDLLRNAASAPHDPQHPTSVNELSRGERLRRQRILARIQS
jgi:hypothetical protein